MPGNLSALLPWWGYMLAVAGGIGFGYLQTRLLQAAALEKGKRTRLILTKFVLWLAALCGLAFLSIPALLVFVASATFMLLGGSWAVFRKTQREER